MIDLNKIFGAFVNFEKVIERVNPNHNITVAEMERTSYKGSLKFWEKEGTERYILVKLTEERLREENIFGGSNLFQRKEISPMENPPLAAIRGKHWEKTSYIVRFSRENTHLGIAGAVMEELAEKVPGCKLCLCQSGHGEPATIAKTDNIYNYATVEGAGFMKIDPAKKEITLFGRSRSFTVSYDHQIKYYLGMTGHEFVAEILKAELPEDWNVVVINNNAETTVTDEREVIPNPE